MIFGDPILCAQFLRGYLDIPLLKEVRPEDIEDVTDYRCFPVRLKDFSNAELMEKGDELSILMLIDKLYSTADLERMNREVDPQYIKEATAATPEYLLTVMAQIVEGLLLKINVPIQEAEDFAEQIKERRMGEWCVNFKGYDVQATRRTAREEGLKEGREEGLEQGREEAIAGAVRMMREASVSQEVTKQQLVRQFGMEPQEAEEKLRANW